VKSTNFITISSDTATIHDFRVAADDNALVCQIQISHPEVPGKRWFTLNERETCYSSRYTGRGDDQKATCYTIHDLNPRYGRKVVAARFHRLAKQIAVGLVANGDDAVQQMERITRTSVRLAL